MIDSHTHLYACEPPAEALVARAREAGVRRLLTVGTDAASCRASIEHAERFEEVYVAIGQHPNHADELDEALLRELAAHPKCVAIGETGLDYYRDGAPRAAQRRAFEMQIELARELGKPLVIHTREAADDTLALLAQRATGVAVVLHCFSLAGQLDACVAAGYWLSFAGNVTYPKNTAIAAAAAAAPGGRLLVETDAPYLAPVPRRGRANEPAAVCETARFVAALRGVSYDELEREVEANAAALLAW
jgi:TatD DNase family protein